jgi:small subunit ribosomal protein S1
MKAAAQDPWETIDTLVKLGESYTGRVTNLMPFGAFVEVRPGIEGLVHVSEMSWTKRIHHPSEVAKIGDVITVSIKTIDRAAKRISLSMKQVEDDPWFDSAARFTAGKEVEGKVERLKNFGAIVELAPGVSGMLPMGAIKRRFGEAYRQAVTPGKSVVVRVQQLDATERKVLLSLPGLDDEDGDADYKEYLKSETAAAAEKAAPAQSEGRVGSFGALLGAKLQKR